MRGSLCVGLMIGIAVTTVADTPQQRAPQSANVLAADDRTAAAVARTEAALDAPVSDMAFIDTPLSEVVQFAGEMMNVPMLIDKKALVEEGINPDDPVTFELAAEELPARTVLDLLLDPLDLVAVNDRGVLRITTTTRAEEIMVVRVYPVGDLVHPPQSPIEASAPAALEPIQFGDGGMGGGLGGVESAPPENFRMDMLVAAIRNVAGASWLAVDGSGGAISGVSDSLVVRQTESAHRQIAQVLAALRKVRANEESGREKLSPSRRNAAD